jgi:hypothetical protein
MVLIYKRFKTLPQSGSGIGSSRQVQPFDDLQYMSDKELRDIVNGKNKNRSRYKPQTKPELTAEREYVRSQFSRKRNAKRVRNM